MDIQALEKIYIGDILKVFFIKGVFFYLNESRTNKNAKTG